MRLKFEDAVTPTILKLADAIEIHVATLFSRDNFTGERQGMLEALRTRAVSDADRLIEAAGGYDRFNEVMDQVETVLDERRRYRREKAKAKKRRQAERLEELEMFREMHAR